MTRQESLKRVRVEYERLRAHNPDVPHAERGGNLGIAITVALSLAGALAISGCGRLAPDHIQEEYTATVRPAMVVVAEVLAACDLDVYTESDLPTAGELREGVRFVSGQPGSLRVEFRLTVPPRDDEYRTAFDAVDRQLRAAGYEWEPFDPVIELDGTTVIFPVRGPVYHFEGGREWILRVTYDSGLDYPDLAVKEPEIVVNAWASSDT